MIRRLVTTAAVLSLTACASYGGSDPGSIPTETGPIDHSDGYTVTLSVTGAMGASQVSWTDPDGQIAQATNVSLPWTKVFQLNALPNLGFVMNAQGDGTAGGPVACEIRVDDMVVAQNESSGDYAMVQCQSGG